MHCYIGFSSVHDSNREATVTSAGWIYEDIHIDPRTDRFGVMGKYSGATQSTVLTILSCFGDVCGLRRRHPSPVRAHRLRCGVGENLYTPLGFKNRHFKSSASNPAYPIPNPGQVGSAFTMQSQGDGDTTIGPSCNSREMPLIFAVLQRGHSSRIRSLHGNDCR